MLNHVPNKLVKFSSVRKRIDRGSLEVVQQQQHERASFQIDRDAKQSDHASYHPWRDTRLTRGRCVPPERKLVNRRWRRPWDVY